MAIHLLKHRTRAHAGTPRPSHVRPGQTWWYTHLRTRRAWRLLAGLIRDDQLFTWLGLAKAGVKVARTTNPLEGGSNGAVKEFLRLCKGLTADHAGRGVDWLLYLQTEAARDPWDFVTSAARTKKPRRTAAEADASRRETKSLYGTSFSVKDGNGIQKVWDGRSR